MKKCTEDLELSCDDPEALNRYLMDLKVCEVPGLYSHGSKDGKALYCHYHTDKGMVVLCVEENEVRYSPLYQEGRADSRTCYLEEPVNRDYILSIVSLSH